MYGTPAWRILVQHGATRGKSLVNRVVDSEGADPSASAATRWQTLPQECGPLPWSIAQKCSDKTAEAGRVLQVNAMSTQ